MQIPNTRDAAKYKLCMQNNIKIILDHEIKLYINYCEAKYGEEFHKAYKYDKRKRGDANV